MEDYKLRDLQTKADFTSWFISNWNKKRRKPRGKNVTLKLWRVKEVDKTLKKVTPHVPLKQIHYSLFSFFLFSLFFFLDGPSEGEKRGRPLHRHAFAKIPSIFIVFLLFTLIISLSSVCLLLIMSTASRLESDKTIHNGESQAQMEGHHFSLTLYIRGFGNHGFI